LESARVHQQTSKQSADHDYVSPPITRRNTGASETPSKVEEKISELEEKSSKLDFDFDWDPEDGMLGVLKKLDRLSTVGEGEDEVSPPYCDMGGFEILPSESSRGS